MFLPPRCPHAACPAHAIERRQNRRFYVCNGTYRPKCRAHRVPRFICRDCGRGFSRQTFRQDYRDHKPHLNAKLLELLAHGLGLRQSAMILKMSRRGTELKARKLSRHLAGFNRNLLDQFPEGSSFQMDEMESFEKERAVLPLTIPVLIEQESMFVIDARSAPIRPSGRMSRKRREAIRRREEAEGARQNEARKCLRQVLREGAKFCKRLTRVRIDTDEKSSYPNLIRRAFGAGVEHRQTSSRLPRDTYNRLFPINHMNAMTRYLTGRLRRRSWLASKRRQYLNLQLGVFQAYKNFVRPRFNSDWKTPAMVLGLVDRQLKPTDMVSWRQDWGWFSPHPRYGQLSIRERRDQERRRGRASFQMPVEKRGFAD